MNGHYELTEMGEHMLAHAHLISHSSDVIERHIAGQDTQLKGTVRITAPSCFSYQELPRHLAELNTHYPGIQVELLVNPVEFNMSKRQADIALRITSAPPDHLVGNEVRRIKWGVYAHPRYIAEQCKAENLKDLQQHKLIGATGALRNHAMFQWLDSQFNENIGPSTDDLVAMSYLASSARWLAILPDDLAHPGI